MSIFCVSCIAATFSSGVTTAPLQDAAGILIVPFENSINRISSVLKGMQDRMRDKEEILSENENLKAQIDSLTEQNNKLIQDQTEYVRLQQMYNLDQQYMFGHSLLVAPVMNEGETEKAVYLPEGEWIDFWHNALTAGGETKTYYADVDSIPVYVKNGSIIPMNLNANYELGGSIGNDVDNYTNLTFRVYPQGNSS